MGHAGTKVNSWNDFDPLKHVIVGKADGCMIPPSEEPCECKIPEDSDMKGMWGPRSQESVDRANAQLDAFAAMLEKRGVRVDRPSPLDFSQEVGTPDWKNGSMFGCMPPRDVLLTIGNKIIEATMSYRSRWFEYLCYRPLVQRYFDEDPTWGGRPRPSPGSSTPPTRRATCTAASPWTSAWTWWPTWTS